MTKRTAEDLVAEWERSGVATVNLDELKALCADNRALREALKELVGLSIMPEHDVAYTLWPEALERARATLKEQA